MEPELGVPRPDADALAAAHAVPPQTAFAEDELAWDDPLDDQLAMAGQEIIRIQQDWQSLDEPYGNVYRGLEQMEEEIQDNTL